MDTEFEQRVDATAAAVEQKQAEFERDLLAEMLGHVGEILVTVQPGMDKIDYVLSKITDTNAPLVSALSQIRNIITNVFLPEVAKAQQRLAQISAGDAEAGEDVIDEDT